MKIPRHLSIFVTTFTLLLGCGVEDTSKTAETSPPEPTGPRWERDGLVVYPLSGTSEFPDAALTLGSIENGQDLSSEDELQLAFEVEGFALGETGLSTSEEGRHIQVLLNGEPYGEYGEPSFGIGFEPGAYVMAAYLAHPHYESLKGPRAGLVRHFTVDGAAAEPIAASSPHLFFNTLHGVTPEGVTPEGASSVEGVGKVLLDFYLLNTELSVDGNRVRATLNGTEFILTEWVAYVVEGLNPGEVEVELELIDAAGDPVPGTFNRVKRVVTLTGGNEA